MNCLPRLILECHPRRNIGVRTAQYLMSNSRCGKISWAGRPAALLLAADITERMRTEQLELERRKFLETITQNQPLDESLNHLVRLLQNQLSRRALFDSFGQARRTMPGGRRAVLAEM